MGKEVWSGSKGVWAGLFRFLVVIGPKTSGGTSWQGLWGEWLRWRVPQLLSFGSRGARSTTTGAPWYHVFPHWVVSRIVSCRGWAKGKPSEREREREVWILYICAFSEEQQAGVLPRRRDGRTKRLPFFCVCFVVRRTWSLSLLVCLLSWQALSQRKR